jgi:hypothetical protein
MGERFYLELSNVMAENGGPGKRPRLEAQGADYVPKNILVTGGAGFIASHIVILLVKKYPSYKVSIRGSKALNQVASPR